jgi:hypothetical protein
MQEGDVTNINAKLRRSTISAVGDMRRAMRVEIHWVVKFIICSTK